MKTYQHGWLFNDTNFTLEINTPDVNADQTYSFIIQTTYPDGVMENYVHITVQPWSISNWDTWSTVEICSLWVSGYQLSDDSKSWQEIATTENTVTDSTETGDTVTETIGPNYNTTSSTTTAQLTVILWVVCSISHSFINGSFLLGAFAVINQIQLLLLLPLMAKYMSNKIVNVILSNGSYTFILDFIPILKFKYVEGIMEEFKFSQPKEYLK